MARTTFGSTDPYTHGCRRPTVCAGYIIALEDIPNPMWRYPMHYIGYHTYGIHGMMLNEFEDTDGWDCPCTLQPGGCPEEDCSIDGEAVRYPFATPCSTGKTLSGCFSLLIRSSVTEP